VTVQLAGLVLVGEDGRRWELTPTGAAAIRQRLRQIAAEYARQGLLHSSGTTTPQEVVDHD
jgi:hypothetical protein